MNKKHFHSILADFQTLFNKDGAPYIVGTLYLDNLNPITRTSTEHPTETAAGSVVKFHTPTSLLSWIPTILQFKNSKP